MKSPWRAFLKVLCRVAFGLAECLSGLVASGLVECSFGQAECLSGLVDYYRAACSAIDPADHP